MGGFYSFPKWQNGAYQSGGHTFRYNYVHDAALGNSFYFDLSHDDMTLYGNVTHKTVRNSWYKHGDQIDSGVPQLVFNYNNLSIEDGAGFEFVAPKPTTALSLEDREQRHRRQSARPFRSQEVIVTNGIATSLGGMTASAALLESTPNSHKAYASDIGFVDMANDDFRLSPASPLYHRPARLSSRSPSR